MNKLLQNFTFILAIILLAGCAPEKSSNATYFGGKIINPKTNFVILYNKEKVVDTLFLNEHNKFFGKYENLGKGFYHFEHGNEYQNIYLVPNDSILIRLNTWDFDETLVFSGIGAEKNNILIDCFLESEREYKNEKLYSFYALDSKNFKEKMDSVLIIKQEKMDDFTAKNTAVNDDYLEVLKVATKYPIYTRFEKYARIHRKMNRLSSNPILGNTFYDYRKDTDINKVHLMYMETYSSYVVHRLYNDVYAQGTDVSSKEFTTKLLNSINQNIKSEPHRNVFLKRATLNEFQSNSSCAYNKKSFDAFVQLSSNEKDKDFFKRLINDIKTLHGGSKLTDFNVTDYLNTKRSIKELTKNKNSVVYFWNPKYIDEYSLVMRLRYLTKRFPNVKFIGVKIAHINNDHVKGIDIKSQYYLESDSDAQLFLTSKSPRTLLINKKGKIVNGFATITSYKFNKQVEYLQKN